MLPKISLLFLKQKVYLQQIPKKDARQAEKAGSKFLWLNKPIIYLSTTPLIYALTGISACCFARDYLERNKKG